MYLLYKISCIVVTLVRN